MRIDPGRLRGFEALRDLTDADLAELAAALQHTKFRTGAQLCREGDEGDGCYFLLSGDVEVTKNLPDGRKVHLATLPAGTMFGQSGLIPGQVRTADVKAEGNVELLSLSRRALGWGLRQGEPWAVVLQATIAVDLVRQLRSALARLSALAADENPEEAASGRKRSDIVQPQALDVTPQKRPAPAAPPPGKEPGEGEEGWHPLPEIPEDDHTNMSQRGLLAETESSLAGMGFDLENVDFVFDEDQQRTADARRQR